MSRALVVLALLAASACGGLRRLGGRSGAELSYAQVQAIQPGLTATQVIEAFGSPGAARRGADGRLQEHRVPWLAIDLRGYGGSASQKGQDLSADARAKSASLQSAMDEDVYGAVRWLVDVKGHDPKRIGVMGAGLGASAALKCAHL